MGKPNGNAALYALTLSACMERQGFSKRSLGKATHPDDPEVGRRNVQRHLSGKFMPSAASQRRYAEVLDAPELAPSDEDEEESLDARLTREVRAMRLHLAGLERRLSAAEEVRP